MVRLPLSAAPEAVNSWSYLRDVRDQLAARSADADVSGLLPDARRPSRPAKLTELPSPPGV